MKLQNMFKKNRKSYIPLKSERPEVPEGLLKKCNKCGAAILTEEVKSAGYICPKCQGYFRVHAYERIRMTVRNDFLYLFNVQCFHILHLPISR